MVKDDGQQLTLFGSDVPEGPRDILRCAFGTEWIAHFPPPVGTGAGCTHCDNYHPPDVAKKGKAKHGQSSTR